MEEILQGDGGEQGDALMPGLFCLALWRALSEIQSNLPATAHVLAYLDDIYIICDRADVVNSFNVARNILHVFCNININMGKLAAWSRTANPLPPGIHILGQNIWKPHLAPELNGIKVVGTPIGTSTFIHSIGADTVRNESKLLNCIIKLDSLQAAWLLLYFCAVPKFNHLLRTVAPSQIAHTAQLHDQQILATFTELFAICRQDAWEESI